MQELTEAWRPYASVAEQQAKRTLPDICIPGVLDCIAGFLSPNDIALGFRLINKAAAAQFSHYTVLKLSLPSPHAVFIARWCSPGAMRSLTLERRRKFLCLTAASGSLDNLRAAITAAGIMTYNEVSEAAAAAGQLHICLWLQQEGWLVGDPMAAAAGRGHREVCEGLLAAGYEATYSAAGAAARGGHAELMVWLLGLVRPLPDPEDDRYERWEVDCEAVWGCDLETLKRLFPNGMPAIPQMPEADDSEDEDQFIVEEEWEVLVASRLVNAAASPTPDWQAKVKWVESQGVPRECNWANSEVVCHPYALERLTWLWQNGYDIGDILLLAETIRAGNTAALEYLLGEVGVPLDWHQYGVDAAANRGHLAMLELLSDRTGIPLVNAPGIEVANVALSAVRGGHLAVVAWLVERFGPQAVPLSGKLFRGAAYSGNMELLVWLRERGCEWDGTAYVGAAEGGCGQVLEWLKAGGCPMPVDGSPYEAAASHDDHATLTWLLEAGVPVDLEQLVKRVSNPGKPWKQRRQEEMLSWLREECVRRQGEQ
ncbi:hypothetical protein Agub_g12501 [Astrephomene gubernaculifera]|uniref:Ankyrin repeat domain-containing protein n=1 Tax=Astrephomene gubernaculifera TaxID=47775 RepID=A0AAD3DYE3_9CHLO|nr:hypothetical protein Agub_g12501 [Astrephomene gubernaculifera]